jgi:hypothetical protein
MALFGWNPTPARTRTAAFWETGPASKAPPGADIGAPWRGTTTGTVKPATGGMAAFFQPPAKPAFGGLGWEHLNPAMQAAVGSAYGRAPAPAQGAAFKAFGQGGLGPAFGALGVGGAAPPPLTYESLNPYARSAIGTAYAGLTPEKQAEVVKTYGTGNLMGVLPMLGMGTGTPDWQYLTPEAQAGDTEAAGRLTPSRQAAAGAAMQSGGFGAALGAMQPTAGPTWGDLTPDAQQAIIAAYKALDPTRQAAAKAAFDYGDVAALIPWLTPAPTGVQPGYEHLSPEAQGRLRGAYEGLNPAAQRAATSAYHAGGLGATMPMLGAQPLAFGDLGTEARDLAVSRYNAMPEGLQAMTRAAGEKGGFAATLPFLERDPTSWTYDELVPYMGLSSRRAKKDIKTLRDAMPGGRGSHIPSPAVGGMANAIGELHGAVRGLAKDVAGIRKARRAR